MNHHSLYGTGFETNEIFRHPIPVVSGSSGRRAAFRYDSGPPPGGSEGLASSAPVFRTSSTIEGGLPFLTFHRNDEFDLIRFSEVVDFYVRDDLIRAVIHDPHYRSSIELYFLGVVLSLWMERNLRPVLHAAVVARGGRSVAFLAGNKSGKSSLAVGCLTDGWSLLSDDLLPLDERSSGFWAHPGYPELRLWPDAVQAALGRDPKELLRVHPGEEKRRVPVGSSSGPGRFAVRAAPLAAIFIPERDADARGVEIRAMESKGEIVRELIGGSFLRSLPREVGVDGRRLAGLGRLAMKVPVLRLNYPAGWDRLAEVVDAVTRYVESL